MGNWGSGRLALSLISHNCWDRVKFEPAVVNLQPCLLSITPCCFQEELINPHMLLSIKGCGSWGFSLVGLWREEDLSKKRDENKEIKLINNSYIWLDKLHPIVKGSIFNFSFFISWILSLFFTNTTCSFFFFSLRMVINGVLIETLDTVDFQSLFFKTWKLHKHMFSPKSKTPSPIFIKK